MFRFRPLLIAVLSCAPLLAASPADGAELTPNERIMFSSMREGGQPDIYSVGAGALQLRNLTRTMDQEEGDVHASRDGRMVAFVRAPRNSDAPLDEIYVMRADGTGGQAVTQTPDHYVSSPSFSPDGTQVAYTAGFQSGELDLFAADLATGATRRISSDGGSLMVDWSPDGRRLAFTRCVDPLTADNGHRCGIWTSDGDGGNATQLSGVAPWIRPAAMADLWPAWSPDGGRIAFTRLIGGQAKTFVMNADGSDQRPLVASTAYDITPAWSQDGSRIAFARFPAVCCGSAPAHPPGGEPGLRIVNADGSDETRLTRPGRSYEDYDPAFVAAGDPAPAAEGDEPADPPPSEPAPAHRRERAGVLIASGKARMSRRGDVAVVLRCRSASVCRGRLELRDRRRVIAARSFAVVRELRVALRLRLPAASRRRIAGGATMRMTARATSGETTATSRPIVVTRGWRPRSG